ncbi:UNVERIFIED_CONTAM: hypothetical protein HDU68_006881 [Siphonaria sp. JEL0065]|nr:hypothetical protein HDU68_006881 [Siphonaria sp. JEL0065]
MQGLFSSVTTLGGPRPLDAKSHYVHSYIKANDHHIGKLRDVMEGYIRNMERIKKKSIKKSMFLKQYGEAEENSESSEFAEMLHDFSAMLLEKEDARDELIARVDVMCLNPLKMYGTLCKKLKEEVHTRDAAVAKEQNKQQQLDKVILKDSSNRPKLNQSQMELAGATHEVTHCTESLIQTTEKFESKKRDDIKTILSELLWSEIKYHAKVLEILSEHHQKLADVSFPEDVKLIEKMKGFQPQSSPTRSLMSPF